MDMFLSEKERALIIEYRKHDEGTKRCVRILLDMERTVNKVISLEKIRKGREKI